MTVEREPAQSPGERFMERVFCGKDLVIEQVVTTTYRAVCPVHGTFAEGLTLTEAHRQTRCCLPKRTSLGRRSREQK